MIVVDLSDKNNLGFAENEASLIATYPVGVYGQHIIVGSTNTTWCWDFVGLAWVDSGSL